MAHTLAGKRARETHRRDQAALSLSVADILRDIFLGAFDTRDIDRTSRLFVRRALPVVLDARRVSHDVAQDYLDTFRMAELEGLLKRPALQGPVHDPLTVDPKVMDRSLLLGPVPPDAVDTLPEVDQVATSLYSSTAGVAKKAIAQGKSPEKAAQLAKNAGAAKAQKLVADGGRAPLQAEVNQARYGAVGYARVVDASPCPFCAMLASRGAVYRSNAFEGSSALFTGDGRFKVHDGCGCSMEPIYGRRVTDLPPESAKYAKQWAEIAAGQPDPFAAWSRWIESGTRPGEEQAGSKGETPAASAPQYGRKKAGKQGSRRKALTEMDRDELARTLRGMYARRAGLERQLAELESAGQSTREPGPARTIAAQLDRLNNQIDKGQARLGTLTL